VEELQEGPKTWFHVFASGPLRHALGLDPKPGAIGASVDFVVVTWVVCAVIILGAYLIGRNLNRIPSSVQSALELFVEYGDNFVRGVIGPTGAIYTPFILTLFVFILLGSVFGIIPGFAATTANINTTIALALVAFIYVNYHSIREVGIVPFVKGFFPPPLWMAPLIGPLEILSHLIRPVTLAVRLFGNIFGEDVVIIVLAGFGISAMRGLWHVGTGSNSFTVGAPIQVLMTMFSVFTDLVQSAVFCMLTTIYIGLLTSHGHGGHDEHHASHGEGVPNNLMDSPTD